MRERGLKLFKRFVKLPAVIVAPHAGAWIETSGAAHPTRGERSLPMRERGLKLKILYSVAGWKASLPMRERGLKLCVVLRCLRGKGVAPHAGAWIETYSPPLFLHLKVVAPHAGAWIET